MSFALFIHTNKRVTSGNKKNIISIYKKISFIYKNVLLYTKNNKVVSYIFSLFRTCQNLTKKTTYLLAFSYYFYSYYV